MRLTLSVIIGALAIGLFFMTSMQAEDLVNPLVGVEPDGYDWAEPERCLGCHHQSTGWHGNTHLENAVGVENVVDPDGTGEGPDAINTGIGWISSKHAMSGYGSNANFYCAWCHAPNFAKVTNDPLKARSFRKKDKSPGMSCIGCHTTHTIAGAFGTRFTNYNPGQDPNDPASYIARHAEDGKQANKQCLWCHDSYHGFAENVVGELHASMVKRGDLRCIDCHMAVFSKTSFGTDERYHNMKVQANGGDSCARCHDFRNVKMDEKIPIIFQGHVDKKHRIPEF